MLAVSMVAPNRTAYPTAAPAAPATASKRMALRRYALTHERDVDGVARRGRCGVTASPSVRPSCGFRARDARGDVPALDCECCVTSTPRRRMPNAPTVAVPLKARTPPNVGFVAAHSGLLVRSRGRGD